MRPASAARCVPPALQARAAEHVRLRARPAARPRRRRPAEARVRRGGRAREASPASSGARRRPCIDTDGRSARLRTRAQNRAITIESAPRSSKKWLSTDTCSAPRRRPAPRRRSLALGGVASVQPVGGQDVGARPRPASDSSGAGRRPYRHRRQVVPLADPRAEPGHHHRVGTQVVEEVAVDRHALDAQDLGEHLGEVARTRREWPVFQPGSGRTSGRGPLQDSDSSGAGRCPASTPTAGRAAYAPARRIGPSASSRHPGHRRNGCRPTRARCP